MGEERKIDEFVERRITTGLIISTHFTKRVRPFWRDSLIESVSLRRICSWCIDYFDKYGVAPDRDIESIYMEKLKTERISKEDAEYMEKVLQRLSKDYERGEQFNSNYLYDQATRYFRERELRDHAAQVTDLIEKGRTDEAEALDRNFQPSSFSSIGLELGTEECSAKILDAFDRDRQYVLRYPGALGEMWNEHLVRGGFVAFLAPEKRGKSFLLIDMGLRALRQKYNVAFFQAGDMTEGQQLKRIGVYLTRRSDLEKYCGEHWRPVGDCVWNQLDQCSRKDRNCDHGIYPGVDEQEYMDRIAHYESHNTLVEKAEEQEEMKSGDRYTPCDSAPCRKRWGTVWMRRERSREPLTGKMAQKEVVKFVTKYKRRFKLATYDNGTLTIDGMRACLESWEYSDDFVPDLIIVDYADLMSVDTGFREFRHRQDAIWKGLRGISQHWHCLVVTATQADAASYTRDRLSLSNFSEDKRKYAHVTAMWGLNQDHRGREKRLGILRVNELVVREGEFSVDNEVCILQDLWIGRPVLESYRKRPVAV